MLLKKSLLPAVLMSGLAVLAGMGLLQYRCDKIKYLCRQL